MNILNEINLQFSSFLRNKAGKNLTLHSWHNSDYVSYKYHIVEMYVEGVAVLLLSAVYCCTANFSSILMYCYLQQYTDELLTSAVYCCTANFSSILMYCYLQQYTAVLLTSAIY